MLLLIFDFFTKFGYSGCNNCTNQVFHKYFLTNKNQLASACEWSWSAFLNTDVSMYYASSSAEMLCEYKRADHFEPILCSTSKI